MLAEENIKGIRVSGLNFVLVNDSPFLFFHIGERSIFIEIPVVGIQSVLTAIVKTQIENILRLLSSHIDT